MSVCAREDGGPCERRADRDHQPEEGHPVSADENEGRHVGEERRGQDEGHPIAEQGERRRGEQRREGHDASRAGVREAVREVARLRQDGERRGPPPLAQPHDDAQREGGERQRGRLGDPARWRARRERQADRENARPGRHLGPEGGRKPRQERRQPHAAPRECRARRQRRRERRLHSAHRVRGQGHGKRDRRERGRPRPGGRRAHLAHRSAKPSPRNAPRGESERLRVHENRQRACARHGQQHRGPRQRRHAVGARPARIEPPPRARRDVPRVPHGDQRVVHGESPHPRRRKDRCEQARYQPRRAMSNPLHRSPKSTSIRSRVSTLRSRRLERTC